MSYPVRLLRRIKNTWWNKGDFQFDKTKSASDDMKQNAPIALLFIWTLACIVHDPSLSVLQKFGWGAIALFANLIFTPLTIAVGIVITIFSPILAITDSDSRYP